MEAHAQVQNLLFACTFRWARRPEGRSAAIPPRNFSRIQTVANVPAGTAENGEEQETP
jgi:hypothetical protein